VLGGELFGHVERRHARRRPTRAPNGRAGPSTRA
jgi:hypothetical protein